MEPELLQLFSQGLNHQCALIKSGEQRYVAKRFHHSFDHTIQTESIASEARVSPSIVFAENGFALYQYINDLGFSENRLGLLCGGLKKTHQLKPISSNELNLLSVYKEYLDEAPNKLVNLHEQLMPLLKEFVEDPTPKVFCHNDLVRENCLFDDQQAWLIDWEFAQINNPWFDIGSIVLYFELDTSQTDELLTGYFEHTKFNASSRLCKLAQLCVLWCDLLWQVSKYGHDKVEHEQSRFNNLIERAKELGIELKDVSAKE